MVHFFEELWRFKDLGMLWAILIALLIVGLKELPKRISNKNVLKAFITATLIIYFLIGVAIINSSNRTEQKESTVSYEPLNLDLIKVDSIAMPIVDSIAIPELKTTDSIAMPADTNSLTSSFTLGTWNVISDDSVISEQIRFGNYGFNEIEVLSSCSASRIVFCDHPKGLNYYRIVSRMGPPYFKEAILRLHRIGNIMNGDLTISDFDFDYEGAHEISTYNLTFTKEYE